MKLTNYQIYEYAQNLSGIFTNSDLYIPVKANFLIQKNIRLIAAAGEEIEKSRIQIAQHYGKLDEEKNVFAIPEEHLKEVNKEINDLFAIEQDLDIRLIQLDDLGNAEFTTKQMQALMFMIED